MPKQSCEIKLGGYCTGVQEIKVLDCLKGSVAVPAINPIITVSSAKYECPEHFGSHLCEFFISADHIALVTKPAILT